MKNKNLKIIPHKISNIPSNSSIMNINNSDVLEIFGIDNENISFFEAALPLKVFQKGNKLNINGEKKYRNLLRNVILQTIHQIKFNKNMRDKNIIQENLKMRISDTLENVKNLTVTKTSKCDVVGKSKRQNEYLEIL